MAEESYPAACSWSPLGSAPSLMGWDGMWWDEEEGLYKEEADWL